MRKRLKSHNWKPIESSKGFWGYHMYECTECGEDTHIGLDIDYSAPLCIGKKRSTKSPPKKKASD